jgi:hypothetical protein
LNCGLNFFKIFPRGVLIEETDVEEVDASMCSYFQDGDRVIVFCPVCESTYVSKLNNDMGLVMG